MKSVWKFQIYRNAMGILLFYSIYSDFPDDSVFPFLHLWTEHSADSRGIRKFCVAVLNDWKCLHNILIPGCEVGADYFLEEACRGV